MTKLILFILLFANAAQAYDCEGCGALSVAAAQLKKVQGTQDLRAHDGAQAAAGKAIGLLRRKMDGTWTEDQAAAVIRALRSETDHGYRQFIIEANPVLFKDNRTLLAKQLRSAPESEAKAIQFDIDAVLRTAEAGNNAPDPKLIEAKKALHK